MPSFFLFNKTAGILTRGIPLNSTAAGWSTMSFIMANLSNASDFGPSDASDSCAARRFLRCLSKLRSTRIHVNYLLAPAR
jgi:hypothetical protein